MWSLGDNWFVEVEMQDSLEQDWTGDLLRSEDEGEEFWGMVSHLCVGNSWNNGQLYNQPLPTSPILATLLPQNCTYFNVSHPAAVVTTTLSSPFPAIGQSWYWLHI